MGMPFYAHLGLSEPWSITKEYANSYLPIVAAFLRGEQPTSTGDRSFERRWRQTRYVVPGQVSQEWDEDEYDDDDTEFEEAHKPQPGSVGLMRIRGVIMKHSQFCGPRGTMDYAQELKRMDSDPNVIGAVMYIESGGGQSYAVKPLTDAMANFSKPLVVLGGSVLASAAYYIASFADEILSEHPRAIIGSIGTMLAFEDIQPALEKLGVAFHEIFATKSTLKNKDSRDALEGKYDLIRQGWLDPLQDDFERDIRSQRTGLANDPAIFAGATFLANVAQEKGMIDGMGNIEQAIERVRELSKAKSNTPSNTNNMNFENVTALAGVENATAEQLDLANGDLTAAGVIGYTVVPESMISEAEAVTTQRDQLQEQVTALTTERDTANQSLATAQQDLATAQARIAELEKGPGAAHARSTGDDSSADEHEIDSILDSLPHNRRADSLI